MKKLFVILLLIPGILLAQKKTEKKPATKKVFVLSVEDDPTQGTMFTDKDFESESGKIHCNRYQILVKDGSEKPVTTPFLFTCPKEKFKTLGLQQLNVIVHTANFKTILKIKNKYTYQPRKVSMVYIENRGIWTCAVEYTAQNDYGALKDGTIFYTYSDNGEEIDSFGR